MKLKFILKLLLMFLFSVSILANDNEKITGKIEELVNRNNIPGLNFSIIHNDGHQENFSHGYADTSNKTLLTPEHTLFTGSIGKTFAVALLMQLVDAGEVDLNNKFIHYFPDTEWLINLPNINDLTVLQLLQHTSGLPRYVNHMGVWETTRNEPDKIWSYKDRLEYIFEDEPVHKAGEGWSYSDTGYLLIGMLIESKLGDYYKNVKNSILSEHKLEYTYAAVTRDLPNLAVGYSDLEDFMTPSVTVENGRYYYNPQMEWTGGGFASSTPDLARWAKLYFNGNLFSDSLKQLIITPSEQGKALSENESCGAGSFIFKLKSGLFYGHTGLMPGYKSIFAYSPELNIAIAMQINCDYATKEMSLQEYVDQILSVL